MTVAHHRSNPTNLVRIDKSSVNISLERSADSRPTAFWVSKLDVSGKKLPDAAHAFVAAYSSEKEIRHDLGQLNALKLQERISLSGFESTSNLHFRIFVHLPDKYELLASCEGLRAVRDGEDNSSSDPLLWVEYEDLGELLWRVRLNGGERPILILNDKHPLDLRAKFEARDALIRSLIVPQAIEQALFYLAINEPPDEDENAWQHQWLRSLTIYGADDPPADINELSDLEKVLEWAHESAKRYAGKIRLGTSLSLALSAGMQ